jgi:hypothetical protein
VIQDMVFQADLKLLQLPYYDVILGIDWLELNGNWLNKWMVVNINGKSIQLQGLLHSAAECLVIEVLLVSAKETETVSPQIPS